MRRKFGRTLIAVVVTLLGLLLIAAITPQGSAAVRTTLFLPQVLTAFPVKLQVWVTRAPIRYDIEFPLAEGLGTADLYVPAGSGRHSAVLFFHGRGPARSG